jgi:hypothetical protein
MLMKKKPDIFLIVMLSSLVFSILFTFGRYVIFRDYLIQLGVHCDPSEESCFVQSCDEGECLSDNEAGVWYYKLLTKKAYTLPDCNKEEALCRSLSCKEGEKNCTETECDPFEVEEGISCFTMKDSRL